MLTAYAFISVTLVRKSRKWHCVTGLVISTEIEKLEVVGALYSLWRPRVHYSYEVNGLQKIDSRLALDNSSYKFNTKSQAQLFIAKYPKDMVVQVYLSAQGSAVLLNDIDWPRKSHYLAVGLAGVIITALGLFLALIFE